MTAIHRYPPSAFAWLFQLLACIMCLLSCGRLTPVAPELLVGSYSGSHFGIIETLSIAPDSTFIQEVRTGEALEYRQTGTYRNVDQGIFFDGIVDTRGYYQEGHRTPDGKPPVTNNLHAWLSVAEHAGKAVIIFDEDDLSYRLERPL